MPAQKPKKSVQAAKSKPAPNAAPKTTAKATSAQKPVAKAVAAPAKKTVAKTATKAAAPAKSVKKAVHVPAKKTTSKATETEKTTQSKVKAEQAEAEVKKTTKKAKTAEGEEKPAKKAAAKAPVKGAKRGPKKKGSIAEPSADEDLSDIEDDLEGEPVAETTEKVKPLRMKISKAKERALMKEFGLDETVLTEEEMNKRRQRLKTLIKLARRAAT